MERRAEDLRVPTFVDKQAAEDTGNKHDNPPTFCKLLIVEGEVSGYEAESTRGRRRRAARRA